MDSRADNFRAIDVMVFEVTGPTMAKNDDRVENGRKKAAKNYRAKMSITNYYDIYYFVCI